MIFFVFLISSCSDLTDEEKKIVGTWSSEEYVDTTYDNGIRFIFAVKSLSTYKEDKIYKEKGDVLIKEEFPFSDVTIRLYSFYHYNSKDVWSADNEVYSDSTVNASLSDNLVAYNSVVAIKNNKTGRIKRYGFLDKEFHNIYDKKVIKDLKNEYIEMEKWFSSYFYNMNKGKTIYKIKSISDNEIVYEDNDGVQTTLKRGNVFSDRIRQMMVEGNALR